jgi:hypothetical protein
MVKEIRTNDYTAFISCMNETMCVGADTFKEEFIRQSWKEMD